MQGDEQTSTNYRLSFLVLTVCHPSMAMLQLPSSSLPHYLSYLITSAVVTAFCIRFLLSPVFTVHRHTFVPFMICYTVLLCTMHNGNNVLKRTFTYIRLTLTCFSIRPENESIPAFAHAGMSRTHKLLLTAVFPISTGIQLCRGNQEENDRENEPAPLLSSGVITAAVAHVPPTVYLCSQVGFLCSHSLSILNKYYKIAFQ